MLRTPRSVTYLDSWNPLMAEWKKQWKKRLKLTPYIKICSACETKNQKTMSRDLCFWVRAAICLHTDRFFFEFPRKTQASFWNYEPLVFKVINTMGWSWGELYLRSKIWTQKGFENGARNFFSIDKRSPAFFKDSKRLSTSLLKGGLKKSLVGARTPRHKTKFSTLRLTAEHLPRNKMSFDRCQI